MLLKEVGKIIGGFIVIMAGLMVMFGLTLKQAGNGIMGFVIFCFGTMIVIEGAKASDKIIQDVEKEIKK